MQSDIQKRIQNAFIISIVAHGVFSLIFIVRYFFSIPTDFFTTMIMTLTVYPAPIILGIIGLSMLSGINREDITGPSRGFYKAAQALSIVAICLGGVVTVTYFLRVGIFHI